MNLTNRDGQTAAHLLVMHYPEYFDNPYNIIRLQSSKINFNVVDNFGNSPMLLSLQRNGEKMADILVNQLGVNFRNDESAISYLKTIPQYDHELSSLKMDWLNQLFQERCPGEYADFTTVTEDSLHDVDVIPNIVNEIYSFMRPPPSSTPQPTAPPPSNSQQVPQH